MGVRPGGHAPTKELFSLTATFDPELSAPEREAATNLLGSVGSVRVDGAEGIRFVVFAQDAESAVSAAVLKAGAAFAVRRTGPGVIHLGPLE